MLSDCLWVGAYRGKWASGAMGGERRMKQGSNQERAKGQGDPPGIIGGCTSAHALGYSKGDGRPKCSFKSCPA